MCVVFWMLAGCHRYAKVREIPKHSAAIESTDGKAGVRAGTTSSYLQVSGVSGPSASTDVPDSSGLSGGAIAGIVFAAAALVGSVTLAGVWYRKTKSAPPIATPQSPSQLARIEVCTEALPVALPIEALHVALPVVAVPVIDTHTPASIIGMPQHTEAPQICEEEKLYAQFAGSQQFA